MFLAYFYTSLGSSSFFKNNFGLKDAAPYWGFPQCSAHWCRRLALVSLLKRQIFLMRFENLKNWKLTFQLFPKAGSRRLLYFIIQGCQFFPLTSFLSTDKLLVKCALFYGNIRNNCEQSPSTKHYV